MKGNYHVAIRYLQKSIKKGSSEPVTYHSISICEYNLGEWENAIENAKTKEYEYDNGSSNYNDNDNVHGSDNENGNDNNHDKECDK